MPLLPGRKSIPQSLLICAAFALQLGCLEVGPGGGVDPIDSTQASLAFIEGSWTLKHKSGGTTTNCSGSGLPAGGGSYVFCSTYKMSITQQPVDDTNADITGSIYSPTCGTNPGGLDARLRLLDGRSRFEGVFGQQWHTDTVTTYFQGVATDRKITIEFVKVTVTDGGSPPATWRCDLSAKYVSN